MSVSSKFVAPVFDHDIAVGWDLVEAVFGQQPDERSRRLARRRLYNLIRTSGLPVFRVNRRGYGGRRTEMHKWLAARERAGANGNKK
jgi:hypothetical protein